MATDKKAPPSPPPASGDGTPPAKGAEKKPAADAGDGGADEGDEGGADDEAAKAAAAAAAAKNGDAGDDEGAEGDDGGGDDDWRERMSGGDPALLKQLQRFASEKAAGIALKEAWAKIREKGGAAVPAADAPLEEQTAFYNQHMGRPEKLEDLKIEPKLPEGETLTEAESTIVGGVLGQLHKAGKFGAVHFTEAAQIVADMLVGGRKEVASRTEAKAKENAEALRKVWPNQKEFDNNVRYANLGAAYYCADVGVDPQALGNLVLEDGTKLGNNPLYAQVFAQIGRNTGEDPNLGGDLGGGKGLAELEATLAKEDAKRNGSPNERREYDSPDAVKRRRDLMAAIKRAKGAGGRKT